MGYNSAHTFADPIVFYCTLRSHVTLSVNALKIFFGIALKKKKKKKGEKKKKEGKDRICMLSL